MLFTTINIKRVESTIAFKDVWLKFQFLSPERNVVNRLGKLISRGFVFGDC
jgi:hypothetical protein